jgi:hypothetical protein
VSLFVAKIHVGNFFYVYVRSWFSPVHYASSAVPRSWLRRVRPVNFEDIFTYDEWVRLRDEIWAEWGTIVAHIHPEAWTASLFGHTVNFQRIVTQHLFKDYLAHRRLIRAIERLEVENAWISDSMVLRYIRSAVRSPGLDVDGKVRVVRGAWFWDLAYLWCRNFLWSAYLACQSFYALWPGKRYTANVLHEGLAFSESGTGPQELSFSWLVERGLCPPDKILFILGCRPKRWAPNILQRYALLHGLGWKTAFLAISHGALILLASIRRLSQLETLLLTEFGLRCIAPYLLVRGREVQTYLTTNAAIWPEHPCVALYNAMGIRTILWNYSANMAFFNQRYLSGERHFYTAHLETAECWLWSQHHRWLWRKGEIPPSQTSYRVIGPVMMGDATPCLMSPAESRHQHLKLPDNANRPWRTIAVFDINPLSKEGQRALLLGPLVITEELVEAFYQHLIMLLGSFSDIRLLVKTKRHDHPYKTKPAAQKRLVDPSGEWVCTGRVIDLDPDTNPYIPIGAADLTIGLPFTSPVIAGLHFGRHGLYHDPLHVVTQHHYHDLDPIISHGYEDLEKKVRYWLYECPEETFQAFLNRPETRQFLGPRPGADPAEEFGQALYGEDFAAGVKA